MLIKRKTIRRSRGGGSADGGGTQTVKVGENEYKQEGGVVSLPQYVTHIDDTIADRYPDNDGKVTLPKIPRSVSVNGSTYTPDGAGDIDLGTIGGGGGSVNSVSANGTTYTPDGSGDVNVGAMVKAIRYINTDYAPDADGKVTINSIAGYFASGLNGLNINGTTQAPLTYDPTTQHIRYDLDANNTTTSLRLMRNSGRNTDAEAYEITFEIVARVVSADDTATRIVAYIDTDVRGEASGLTWMLCLSRYVAGSTPLAIAIKGLSDAPRYWTANDAKLRQGSYSGTSGFHCDAFADNDLTQWSSAALAAHAEPLYEGHRRYMLDVTITASKTYTVHAFDDVSRGAVGVNAVEYNNTLYEPDPTGLLVLPYEEVLKTYAYTTDIIKVNAGGLKIAGFVMSRTERGDLNIRLDMDATLYPNDETLPLHLRYDFGYAFGLVSRSFDDLGIDVYIMGVPDSTGKAYGIFIVTTEAVEGVHHNVISAKNVTIPNICAYVSPHKRLLDADTLTTANISQYAYKIQSGYQYYDFTAKYFAGQIG